MNIATKDGSKIINVGTASFLYSFYSTICLKVPTSIDVSEGICFLQRGRVSAADCAACAKAFERVREVFLKLSPKEVIWNKDNLSQQPPWGNNISPDITSLGNYFVTASGEDLLKALIALLWYANESKTDVLIT